MRLIKQARKIIFKCFCINLLIGVLFAWSIFKNALVNDLGWSNSAATIPYTFAIISFSISLLIAGILQDKHGPRPVLLGGTLSTSFGLILSAYSSNPMSMLISFGIFTGAGIGFSYACLSPVAMKWVHPNKRGIVNGIIAAGFGLAAVYLAPLISFLINNYSLSFCFITLGITCLFVVVPLALTIKNPSSHFIPERKKSIKKIRITSQKEYTWSEMIKTKTFIPLWFMYLSASSTGLMIIGNITSIAAIQTKMDSAAYLVAILALFNTLGRVFSGILADKIGGIRTLTVSFILQIVNLGLFRYYNDHPGMILGAILTGLSYGTLPAVFPVITAGFYGLKNYGTNYGVLYTAWGVSGFIGPVIASYIVDSTGTFNIAYLFSIAIMIFGLILSFSINNAKSNNDALTKNEHSECKSTLSLQNL